MSTILLDADILAFKNAATAQDVFDWGDGDGPQVSANIEQAIKNAERYIEALQSELMAHRVVICLSCREHNFRYDYYPEYKSNRLKNQDKRPVLLQEVKDWLEEEYESMLRYSLEADDIMGILATHPHLIPGRKIMVSQDKDMKTIPGWYFNPDKDKKPYLISERDAERFHLFQTLTGDTVDGYPGAPGIGPVAAEAALDSPVLYESYEHTFVRGKRASECEVRWRLGEPCSVWDGIVSLYEKRGLDEAAAVAQARCARILRAVDYDFKNKEVIPWTPDCLREF